MIFIFLSIIKFYTFIIKNTNFDILLINHISNNFKNENISFNNRILNNTLNNITTLKNEIIKEPIKEVVDVFIEKEPLVYIYNTHDTEEYSKPIKNAFSITPNVKIASYILKDHLNDLGIESIVEKRSIKEYLNKHQLNYYGSYDASRYYLKDNMSKNDFKIVIDLHRDSIKKNKSTLTIDNKNYAKVLFVLTTKHEGYKNNEKFVKELNSLINKKLKGLSRGIMYRDDVIFNQDLMNNAILLEVGGVDNNIEEVNNTLFVIASVINEYLTSEGING